MSGKRFGNLVVIRKSEKKAKSGSMWECRCDCGNMVTVARCGLISGHTKSCGCKRKQFLSNKRPALTHQDVLVESVNVCIMYGEG